MNPELKACPFCGNPAKLKRVHGNWGYTPDQVSAGCGRCGVRFRFELPEGYYGQSPEEKKTRADEIKAVVHKAAETWNTRKEPIVKPDTPKKPNPQRPPPMCVDVGHMTMNFSATLVNTIRIITATQSRSFVPPAGAYRPQVDSDKIGAWFLAAHEWVNYKPEDEPESWGAQ